MIDNEILKQEPFLDPYYNETYMWVLPKDPCNAYAIFEVGEGTKEYLTKKFGDNFLQNNFQVIRVYQIDNQGVFTGYNYNNVFEIDDYIQDKNDYWFTLHPDHDYICEIGYKAKNSNFFEMVARSNSFRMPKNFKEKEEKYVEWAKTDCEYHPVYVQTGEDDWRFNLYKCWREGCVHNKPPEKGYWVLMLHNHLPFVRHPEHDISLEEQWLFEAITSVYTQLLAMFWRLEKESIDFRLTLSLSPPLISMLQDKLLQDRYRRHISEVISFAEKEYAHSHDKPFRHTLELLLSKFHKAKEVFESYSGDITHGFRDFQNLGKLEICVCPATHAILPFYLHYPEAIRAQIQIACRQYERVFGCWPRGIWLPENAYAPALDLYLREQGIKWTMVNTPGIRQSDTKVLFDVYAPVITHSGLTVFGIDEETKSQVWSKKDGYPGDGRYKDWYKDVGYEADWDYLPPYFKEANIRRSTGLKYHRVTERTLPLDRKEYYHPEWAGEAIAEHAGQFVYFRGLQALDLQKKYNRNPVIFSAYDGELFGHWWEEGPAWIETVFRKMLYDQSTVRPVTPSEYLYQYTHHQKVTPGISSWGTEDYFGTWLDGRDYQPNTWIFRHIFKILDRLINCASAKRSAEGLEKRALDQAARELLLAQSSDWGFLIQTGQAIRYSEMRIVKHLNWAKELLREVEEGQINQTLLESLENANTIFNLDMDFRVFCRGL
ncbi:MAG: 1,4-alpha-glucan branching protein domain-containing protein [bacterium]